MSDSLPYSHKVSAGKIHDKNGYPIHSGDLCRQIHYRSGKAHQKIHWLYHVAAEIGGYIRMVPTCHLDPYHAATQGGAYWLTEEYEGNLEIVIGYGPSTCLDFTDRPRKVKP